MFEVTSAGKVILRNERHLKPKDLLDDGPSGSRPEDQTPRQTNEATFAKQLAQALFRMHHAGEFEALILIADPQTLGQLRAAMHTSVTAAIIRSLHKHLTNHSVEQICEALR